MAVGSGEFTSEKVLGSLWESYVALKEAERISLTPAISILIRDTKIYDNKESLKWHPSPSLGTPSIR